MARHDRVGKGMAGGASKFRQETGPSIGGAKDDRSQSRISFC